MIAASCRQAYRGLIREKAMSMIAVMSVLAALQAHALPLSSEARASDQPTLVRENAAQSGTAREEAQAGTELVCKMEQITGLRFPVRRCRPAQVAPNAANAVNDELRRVQILREVPLPGTIRNGG
jgi:hypothetical protein